LARISQKADAALSALVSDFRGSRKVLAEFRDQGVEIEGAKNADGNRTSMSDAV